MYDPIISYRNKDKKRVLRLLRKIYKKKSISENLRARDAQLLKAKSISGCI